MIERVSPQHPDKQADRIAGALVDLAYKQEHNPKVAVEVLIGHGVCHIINETSVKLNYDDVKAAVKRISGVDRVDYIEVAQDKHLAKNQKEKTRCGDNGIFKGCPVTREEKQLTAIAQNIYASYPYDGKYILDGDKLVICQSNVKNDILKLMYPFAYVNPLGEWTGGSNVDTGATNRKLGSDMGRSVTGGGLHGKDLSKADVSVNIYAFLEAQKREKEVELSCAIGDEEVDGLPYEVIVEIARNYINKIGGFEKFAEWGLIR